jgi:hypothetical protein
MKLYDSYYINFAHSIPRPVLEDFASLTIQSNSHSQVAQVYDQYLDYVCLDSNLFSLQLTDAYYRLNDANVTEAAIEELTTAIVSSLFSVIISLGDLSFHHSRLSTLI